MIEFDLNIKAVELLDQQIGEAVEAELATIMAEGADRARGSSKFKDGTGELRRSIVSGLEGSWLGGDLQGVLLAEAEHASYVEEGTRPHEILPRNKRALSWPKGKHPVRKVMHPGTKATEFIRKSINPGGASVRISAAAAAAVNRR